MVTCKTYGRMGNFLFQAATTIAYALKHEQPYTLPSTTKDAFNNPIYLQHLAKPLPQLPSLLVAENGHAFQEIPFKPSWAGRNIVLDGYWQSEKYFKDYRNEILDLFNYPWEPPSDTVSVHVRRGDYLRLTHKHPAVTQGWYEAAMARFAGRQFRFFSDDIEWCQDAFKHVRNCQFSVGNTIEQDLIQMSNCEHHISSASTFGWWGAWLNRNPHKQVLIPEQWFAPREAAKLDTSDIVPADWIKIPN